MNKRLYLTNKLSIYQRINIEQINLLHIYNEGIQLRLQYPINHPLIQENKDKIIRQKELIQELKDRIILLTL